MTVIKRDKVVPFTPQQMYDLVNEVENYPDFLPWCSATTVHYRDEDEAQASIVVSAKGYSKSFTTHNRLQKNKMIEIRLVDGPFSHLEGFWRFDPVEENQCRISFDLEFEFATRLLSSLIGPLFGQISDAMVDAFCERAESVYGTADANG